MGELLGNLIRTIFVIIALALIWIAVTFNTILPLFIVLPIFMIIQTESGSF
jgi:hypothetical protein